MEIICVKLQLTFLFLDMLLGLQKDEALRSCLRI